VRIVQRGNGARFVLEAAPRFRISGERTGEDLDGDGSIEPRVARTVDFAHAPGAERGDDLVRTKTHAWFERHVDVWILPVPKLSLAWGRLRTEATGSMPQLLSGFRTTLK